MVAERVKVSDLTSVITDCKVPKMFLQSVIEFDTPKDTLESCIITEIRKTFNLKNNARVLSYDLSSIANTND